MYCEYLIEQFQEKSRNSERMQIAGEFYVANYNLLHKLKLSFGVRDSESDDYYQLCYLAIVDALVVYQRGQNSFLAYYRRCIMHRLHLYRMEFSLPFRVKGKYPDVRVVDVSEITGYSALDKAYSEVEESLTAGVVWQVVAETVRPVELRILELHFVQEKTYGQIGELLGYAETQIKTKKNNAFRKLKRCKEIQIIAAMVYGLHI